MQEKGRQHITLGHKIFGNFTLYVKKLAREKTHLKAPIKATQKNNQNVFELMSICLRDRKAILYGP